jgi:hypothetical protein
VPGSVEFAGGTAMPDTLAVITGAGVSGMVRLQRVSAGHGSAAPGAPEAVCGLSHSVG